MHEIIVQAFVDRIRAGMMEIEQVPEIYRSEVLEKLNNLGSAGK